MSPLFGKKGKPSTIAVLDIESGSVGSALIELTHKQKPKLLGQERDTLALRGKPSGDALLSEIEKEIERSLVRLSEISSRMKAYRGEGSIDRIAVFLHAPWAGVAIKEGRAHADAHEDTLSRLRGPANVLEVPVTFHAFATTATPVVHGIFNAPQEALVISIGGEVAELSLLQDGLMRGYATVPVGLNTVLRTLEAHSGVSRHEALSMLSLSRSTREHAWAEALAAGVGEITAMLRSGASDLVAGNNRAQQIFVISRDPSADFFARAFTEDEQMHELFAPGTTARAVLPRHASAHLSTYPPRPDVPLLLESLFVDTRFGA